jgi:glycogen(starch) synthase
MIKLSEQAGSTRNDSGVSVLVVEVAWEVCNQLGGIYTVLKTKAPAMVNRWGENYLMVGPYNPEAAGIEFEPLEAPDDIAAVQRSLRHKGIEAHYGRWLIPGSPRTLLLECAGKAAAIDADKYLLWRDNGIPTEGADHELNSVITFGFAVFEFLSILSSLPRAKKIVAHFHEWMAGVALPRIAHCGLPIATVFTTHATLLGRYVASNNPHFYEQLDWMDPDETARRYNIFPRFSIERAAAHSATVFTTISEVTAREARRFLGRSVDAILPNGINVQRFTALHEFQNLHLKYKEKIHEFVMGHFFPSYRFDLDRTIYLFTSGRYEYTNKGMDVFIETLYRLNQRLKETIDPPTVVGFIVTRGWTKNVNVNALQNHLRLEDLDSICSELVDGMRKRLLLSVAGGKLPSYEELLPDDFQARFKRAMFQFKSKLPPSIVTHDMGNDSQDAVLNHLRHRRLFNDPNDPVKVIYHPEFITHASPLFNLDYDQFVRGCHMGIFPSYYEPWGYTPPECLAMGIPTVTTDLSGFGAYVLNNISNAQHHGISVLNRSTQSADQTIEDLTNHVLRFLQLSRRERIQLRNRAERLTERFDWAVLAEHYHKSQNLALERALNYLPA